MGAEIISFRPKKATVEPDVAVEAVVGLLTAANEPEEDVQARYHRSLPLAREFVEAWIDQPDALIDFLAWAHARGALKF